MGRHHPPRRHARPDARSSAPLSLAIVLGLRRFAPVVPGSLVAVIFGVVVVKLFDLADKGVEIVGDIDSGLPSLGLPDGVGVRRLPPRCGRGGRDHARRLRRGPRRGEDVRRPRALRDRRQPRAARPRRGEPRSRVELRDGRQRQPLEDRRQRLGRRQVADVRARRRRADGRHAAVPHRAVRGPARGDARRRRDRRRHRARRHPRAARVLRASTPGGSGASTARRRGPTSSPPSRRCSAC